MFSFFRRSKKTRKSRSILPIRRLPLYLERLEDRILLSTDTWSGVSGYWDDGTNWSLGQAPGAGDIAKISTSSAVTITIQSGDTIQVQNVTTDIDDTLSITGGSLTVTSGTSTIKGPSSITGGTLAANAAITLSGNSEWVGGTIQATEGITTPTGSKVTLPGGANVTVSGTITDNGTIELAPTTGFVTLIAGGDVTLTGTGKLLADAGGPGNGSGTFYSFFQVPGGDTVTNAAGQTIQVASTGALYFQGSGTVVNRGLMVNADFENTSVTNDKMLQITSGGETYIGTSTTVDNISGQIQDNAGRLVNDGTISGGSVNLANGSILTDENSSGTITGSTLTFTGDSLIQGSPTLTNITVPSGSNLLISASAATFVGTITNNGTIELDPNTNFVYLNVPGNVTLSGAGQFVMDVGGTRPDGLGYYAVVEVGSGATLTNSAGHTIEGSGYFQGSSTAPSPSVVNQGSILGNVHGQLIFEGISLTNAGDLQSTNSDSVEALDTTTIDNEGLIEANGGSFTVDASSDVSQLSGTTLTGGTWEALAGSTLSINSATTITTNDANITLSGAGSTFTNLSTNSLTNNGNLTLGPGSTLSLAGNYAQSTTGSLTVQLGGAPTSGSFGQLIVKGIAALAGTLNIGLANGYVPLKGDTFPVVSYASESGSFGSIQGLYAGRLRLFSAVVGANNIQIAALIDAAELAVTGITIPANGIPGQNVSITYTVQNTQNIPTAVSSWIDSVYLSASATLDASAKLIGRVQHDGSVAANGTYSETLTAPLPGVVPGKYYVIVVANSRGLLPDVDQTKNVLASTDQISVSIPSLTPGVATSGTIDEGQDVYYQVNLLPGQAARITAQFGVAAGGELYVGYQYAPDEQTYDDYGFNAAGSSQQILLTSPQAGTYYILLHGREGSAGGQAFKLLVQELTFAILGVSPSQGGNSGDTTVAIQGSQLSPNTVVSLVGQDGTRHPAVSVLYQNSGNLYTTFDLTGMALGTYDVRIDDSGLTDTDAAAFTVVPANPGQVVYNMSAPSFVRGGEEGTVTVTYENIGNTDAPAPLLEITGTNALMRLEDQPTFAGPTAQFLAINPDGPAGILPPGKPFQITLYFQAATGITQGQILFTLGIADLGQTIDWSDSKAALQPPSVSNDAWNADWSNFLSSVGSTAGQLQSALDQDATYLSTLGEYTDDPDRLISFELQKADDFGAITQRYTLGAFGRGWPDPTSIKLTTDSAGDVAILYSGQERLFFIQPDGSYQGVPGDAATLTKEADGSYQLRETDGTITAFSPDGTLAYTKDTNGNKIAANYTNGLLTSLVDSTGDTVSFSYTNFGGQERITQVTDPVGRITTYSYDPTGQELMSVSDPTGTTSYTYTTAQTGPQAFAVASIAYPDGSHTYFTYDSQGRLTSQYADGGAQKVTYSYDGEGGTSVTDADKGTSTYFVNEYEQVAAYVDSLGHYFQFTFDANHNLIGETGPGGISTSFTNNAAGDTTSATDPLGRQLRATFNSGFNELTSLTDAKGNTTQYGYDPNNGNLLSIAYPDSSQESFQYDPTGNLIESVDRNGNAIGYKYDSHNLLTEEDFADGSKITYKYDSHRNLISATNSTGTTSFQYDAADRLTMVTYPNNMSLTFTYDPKTGQRTQMVDQTGFTVNYQYDAVGRLSGLTDSKGNMIVLYKYDSAGRLIEKDMGNGTYTKYAYDLAGNLTSIVNYAPDKSVISEELYTYDDQGRPIRVKTLNGTTTYGYDASGQLTSVSLPGGRTITYKYDAAGNRISVTDNGVTTNYTTNNLNEYTQVGSTQYAYDKDGNLISQTDSTGTTTYSYNLLGQLASVVSPTGTWTYQYDALGNRESETQNGQETQYLIDPTGIGNVVGTFDGSGNVIDHYTQGLGLTSQVSDSGATSYYNFDLTGDTTELTGASGSVLNSYSYLPFGEVLSAGGTAPNPFLYVGQFGVMSDGSGQYYMRNRYYMPAVGQFLSVDPVGLGGGDTNLRRYVSNNPLASVDPSGEVPIQVILLLLSQLSGTPTVSSATQGTYQAQQQAIQQTEAENIHQLGEAGAQGLKNTQDAASTANELAQSASEIEAVGGTAEGAAGTAEVTSGVAEVAATADAPVLILLGGEFIVVYQGTRYISSHTGLDQFVQKGFAHLFGTPPEPGLSGGSGAFGGGGASGSWESNPLSPEGVAGTRGASAGGKLVPLPVLIEDL